VVRNRQEAQAQQGPLRDRLSAGHRLLLFAEGTSTDGRRVLPFKPTLLQPFFDPELAHHGFVLQAVSVIYIAPDGEPSDFYGWWGEMGFGENLLHVLAVPKQGEVRVVFHSPRKVEDYRDRKGLAADLEVDCRKGLNQHLR